MTYFDASALDNRAASPASGDLLRTALILTIFAVVALGLMLAAATPGSPLAQGAYTGIEWHGNVAASTGG